MQLNANILVLMGGPDAERDVSIMSGREVAQALRACRGPGCHVVDRVIDRPDVGELAALAAEATCDVIFPVLHGHWGEGGPLQELLEQLGVPYVGSGPLASAMAMDKLATKNALGRAGGALTPRSIEIAAHEPCPIAPPLVLKPVDDGSSVDLRICRSADEVAEARTILHARRPRLMAEQYVRGREVTAGILFDRPLPLVEVIPGPGVEYYDYEAKYVRDDTRYVIDPPLVPGVAEEIARIAMLGFEELGCRDIARVDFIVDDRGPWFLEINTMPGFTTHSLVPMAAASLGMDMPRICAKLVESAMMRNRAKPLAATAPVSSEVEVLRAEC